ncbi:TonB-dependent receptor plug [Rhodospirillaceae bacterium LM-1]|nr:TonB-dependent receptor plug [Rhodospirillaceae bacterium LM-1]
MILQARFSPEAVLEGIKMKKTMRIAALLAPALGCGAQAYGQEVLDDVWVTATRSGTSLDRTGSSITVIDSQKIEAKQTSKVEELLKATPGVSVVRFGGAGGSSQINLRGTNSNHTTVLIDGQRANFQDPSSYTFDFDWMQTDNIERIEILRGPSAGQWGADTIGGVVNIVTKKGKGPAKVTLTGEYGSFDTDRESLGVTGGGERYDYNLNVSRFSTGGWSIASSDRNFGTERDSTQNATYQAKIGISPTDNSEIEARYAHTDFETDLDGTRTGGGTQDTNRGKYKHVDSGHVKGTLGLFEGFWTQTATASMMNNDQWNTGGTTTRCTTGQPAPLCTGYDSSSTSFSWQNDLKFNQNNTTTIGVETLRETYMQKYYQQGGRIAADTEVWTNAGYIQHQTRLFDVLDLTGGYRGTDHQTAGWHPTYFGNAAYHLPTNTTLKGSYGTTFKAPSHYQIYYPSGTKNLELLPEEGRGWDVGFEQKFLSGKLKTGATYFQNNIRNMIEYVSSSTQYQNVSEATTYGVETFLNYQVFDESGSSLSVAPNYTYTRAYSRAEREELTRRPRHAFGSNVNYRFFEKRAQVNMSATYQTDFHESRSSTTTRYPVKNGEYFKIDLASSYDVTDNFQLFGRVDNLTDSYIESAYGYAESGGIGVFAGVKVTFEPGKFLTGEGK